VDIPGFSRLLYMFHFRVVQQTAYDGGTGVFIDEMTMQHLMVLGDNIMLFNRVKVLEKEKSLAHLVPTAGNC
jgi:hypothetical protein